MKMDDIARLANVSKSAVSLALNNKPGISDETRDRIMKIVRESGYLPRSMVSANQVYGVANTIRFAACTESEVVSHQYSSSTFFAELIHGLEKKCRELGYALIYSSVERNNMKEGLEAVEREHAAKGTILLGTNLNAFEIKQVLEIQPNLVVLDNLYPQLNVNFIVMNNQKGAYDAAEYIIKMGHRNVGYVQSEVRVNNLEMRKQGFMMSLSESNLKVKDEDVFSVGYSIERAQNDFKSVLEQRSTPMPEALFCETDYLAIGVIKALQQAGIQVPQQVSVVGFDNVSQSTIISPELTTIHVEKEKLGALAVQRLDEIIRTNDTTTVKCLIDTQLIERNSCVRRVTG